MAMKSFNLQIYYNYRWMFSLEKTNCFTSYYTYSTYFVILQFLQLQFKK